MSTACPILLDTSDEENLAEENRKRRFTELDVEKFCAETAKKRARVEDLTRQAKDLEEENEVLSKIVRASESFKEILAKKYMEKQNYYILSKTGYAPPKNEQKLSVWHIQYLRKNTKRLEEDLQNRRNVKAKVQWLKSELQRRRENMQRVVEERKIKQGQLKKVLEALSEALPMVSSYRSKVEEQEQRVLSVENSLENALTDRRAWKSLLDSSICPDEIWNIGAEIETVKTEIKDTETRIQSLMESIEDLRKEANSARANVKHRRDLLEDIKEDLLAQDDQWKLREEELIRNKEENKIEVAKVTAELKLLQKKLQFMTDILCKSLDMFKTIKLCEEQLFSATGASVTLNISASLNNARKVANANPIMSDVREEQDRLTNYLTMMIPRYEVQRATLHENRTAIREKMSRVEVLRSRIAALKSYMKHVGRDEDMNDILGLKGMEDTFCRSFEVSEIRIDRLEKTRAMQRSMIDNLRKMKTECIIYFMQAMRSL